MKPITPRGHPGTVGNQPLIGALETRGEAAQSITLQALTVVEGAVAILSSPEGPYELRFPRLETIGTEGQSIVFNMAGSIRSLELPQLRVIYGDLVWMTRLCTLDARKVERVTGDLSLGYSPQLLFSAAMPLITATRGTKQIGPIGCCFATDRNDCMGADLSASTCAASNCQQ